MTASSTLENRYERHPAIHAFDGRLATAWNDGRPGSGVGEWLEASFPRLERFATVSFSTGFDVITQANGDLFYANAQIRRASIFVDGRWVRSLDVPQHARATSVDLGGEQGTTIRIVVDDVYPGLRWQDVCISEVGISAWQ